MENLSFRVQCISISLFFRNQCYLQEFRNRIVCFTLTCVFSPVTCCAFKNFWENTLPPFHVTACSVPDVKSRLTQMSNKRKTDCIGELNDDFCSALVVAHRCSQINVTAFNFFFISCLFYPQAFSFSLVLPVASVHPGDRCTIGALKLSNVYIIHIAPQKVLIKLYMANGVGSHKLNVLPISPMSHTNWQRKDKVLLGVWFEDSLDLTSELFAFSFLPISLFHFTYYSLWVPLAVYLTSTLKLRILGYKY